MRITDIEIAVEYNNSGEYDHMGYFETIDEAIRFLKKLKKATNKQVKEDEWNGD